MVDKPRELVPNVDYPVAPWDLPLTSSESPSTDSSLTNAATASESSASVSSVDGSSMDSSNLRTLKKRRLNPSQPLPSSLEDTSGEMVEIHEQASDSDDEDLISVVPLSRLSLRAKEFRRRYGHISDPHSRAEALKCFVNEMQKQAEKDHRDELQRSKKEWRRSLMNNNDDNNTTHKQSSLLDRMMVTRRSEIQPLVELDFAAIAEKQRLYREYQMRVSEERKRRAEREQRAAEEDSNGGDSKMRDLSGNVNTMGDSSSSIKLKSDPNSVTGRAHFVPNMAVVSEMSGHSQTGRMDNDDDGSGLVGSQSALKSSSSMAVGNALNQESSSLGTESPPHTTYVPPSYLPPAVPAPPSAVELDPNREVDPAIEKSSRSGIRSLVSDRYLAGSSVVRPPPIVEARAQAEREEQKRYQKRRSRGNNDDSEEEWTEEEDDSENELDEETMRVGGPLDEGSLTVTLRRSKRKVARTRKSYRYDYDEVTGLPLSQTGQDLVSQNPGSTHSRMTVAVSAAADGANGTDVVVSSSDHRPPSAMMVDSHSLSANHDDDDGDRHLRETLPTLGTATESQSISPSKSRRDEMIDEANRGLHEMVAQSVGVDLDGSQVSLNQDGLKRSVINTMGSDITASSLVAPQNGMVNTNEDDGTSHINVSSMNGPNHPGGSSINFDDFEDDLIDDDSDYDIRDDAMEAGLEVDARLVKHDEMNRLRKQQRKQARIEAEQKRQLREYFRKFAKTLQKHDLNTVVHREPPLALKKSRLQYSRKKVDQILHRRINIDKITGFAMNEYFVVYKGLSHIHSEWVSELILNKSKSALKKIKLWLKKSGDKRLWDPKQGSLFDPSWVQVERLLAGRPGPGYFQGDTRFEYLCKFVGLNYSHCRWEFPEDIDDDSVIIDLQRRNILPTLPINRGSGAGASSSSLDKSSVVGVSGLQPFRPRPNEWRQISSKDNDSGTMWKGGNKLHEWQIEGVNWLTFNWYNRRGSILADEMGLGKTVQIVATLDTISKVYCNGPFLIVAPLSTVNHWLREVQTWTDLNAIIYQGKREDRRICKFFEFHYFDAKNGRRLINSSLVPYKFNVCIATFESIMLDDEFTKIHWRMCVVDEAHRLKNRYSKLSKYLAQCKIEHNILLTGTPIQNNLEELFNLLHFISPSHFIEYEDFTIQFGNGQGKLENDEDLQRLHQIIRPYFLRRLKEDVAKFIPPKKETVIEVELTRIQKQYYRAIFEGNREFLTAGMGNLKKKGGSDESTAAVTGGAGGGSSSMSSSLGMRGKGPSLMNISMQLRKVCNHPYLIRGVFEKVTVGCHTNTDYLSKLVDTSGKFVLLDKLLPKLKEGGHRVLIFSQMRMTLDLLDDYLRLKQWNFERIDGAIRGNERQGAIDRFCDPLSDAFVFLLTTRAGGVGINLMAADTVIIFDSDWNPQNDIQAMARCHRIGQDKEVKIYRLITARTYEKDMFVSASKKLGLGKAIMGSMNSELNSFLGASSNNANDDPNNSSHSSSSSSKRKGPRAEEINSWLKHGAYDLFRDDDTEADMFCSEDIDQILSQRTTDVVVDQASGKSSFSKATFAMTGDEATDVDVSDADFWNKVLPKQLTAYDLIHEIQNHTLSGNDDSEFDYASSSSSSTMMNGSGKKTLSLSDLYENVIRVKNDSIESLRKNEHIKNHEIVVQLLQTAVSSGLFSDEQNDLMEDAALYIENPRRHKRNKARKDSRARMARQASFYGALDENLGLKADVLGAGAIAGDVLDIGLSGMDSSSNVFETLPWNSRLCELVIRSFLKHFGTCKRNDLLWRQIMLEIHGKKHVRCARETIAWVFAFLECMSIYALDQTDLVVFQETRSILLGELPTTEYEYIDRYVREVTKDSQNGSTEEDSSDHHHPFGAGSSSNDSHSSSLSSSFSSPGFVTSTSMNSGHKSSKRTKDDDYVPSLAEGKALKSKQLKLDPTTLKIRDFPSFSDSFFSKMIKHDSRKWAKHLRLACLMRKTLRKIPVFDKFDSLVMKTVFSKLELPQEIPGDMPTKWWTEEDDKYLIIGCAKHGIHDWEMIRLDKSLPFMKKMVNFEIASIAASEMKKAKRMRKGKENTSSSMKVNGNSMDDTVMVPSRGSTHSFSSSSVNSSSKDPRRRIGVGVMGSNRHRNDNEDDDDLIDDQSRVVTAPNDYDPKKHGFKCCLSKEDESKTAVMCARCSFQFHCDCLGFQKVDQVPEYWVCFRCNHTWPTSEDLYLRLAATLNSLLIKLERGDDNHDGHSKESANDNDVSISPSSFFTEEQRMKARKQRAELMEQSKMERGTKRDKRLRRIWEISKRDMHCFQRLVQMYGPLPPKKFQERMPQWRDRSIEQIEAYFYSLMGQVEYMCRVERLKDLIRDGKIAVPQELASKLTGHASNSAAVKSVSTIQRGLPAKTKKCCLKLIERVLVCYSDTHDGSKESQFETVKSKLESNEYQSPDSMFTDLESICQRLSNQQCSQRIIETLEGSKSDIRHVFEFEQQNRGDRGTDVTPAMDTSDGPSSSSAMISTPSKKSWKKSDLECLDPSDIESYFGIARFFPLFDHGLSIALSVKIWRRVVMWNHISEVEKKLGKERGDWSKLDRYFSTLSVECNEGTTSSKLPSKGWWIPAIHDKLVLRMVMKHGLGDVESVMGDAEFKRCIDQDKRDFFKTFLMDKKPILKRLRYVSFVISHKGRSPTQHAWHEMNLAELQSPLKYGRYSLNDEQYELCYQRWALKQRSRYTRQGKERPTSMSSSPSSSSHSRHHSHSHSHRHSRRSHHERKSGADGKKEERRKKETMSKEEGSREKSQSPKESSSVTTQKPDSSTAEESKAAENPVADSEDVTMTEVTVTVPKQQSVSVDVTMEERPSQLSLDPSSNPSRVMPPALESISSANPHHTATLLDEDLLLDSTDPTSMMMGGPISGSFGGYAAAIPVGAESTRLDHLISDSEDESKTQSNSSLKKRRPVKKKRSSSRSGGSGKPAKPKTFGVKKSGSCRVGGGGGIKKKLSLIERYTNLPRDNTGAITTPFEARKGVVIRSLGTVTTDPKFCSPKYIWPVGYCSARSHPSYLDPKKRITYISTIVNQNGEPYFEVVAEDDPAGRLCTPSPSNAWTTIVKRVAKAKQNHNRRTLTVSGPEQFGFADPLVQACIEELPNAHRCTEYWRNRDKSWRAVMGLDEE